ncbi:MAG: hypothetical protein N3A54_01505 [Patescibacteria group bacterium]|nr:hypothetical protein [Patescibacteria group bacterium]
MRKTNKKGNLFLNLEKLSEPEVEKRKNEDYVQFRKKKISLLFTKGSIYELYSDAKKYVFDIFPKNYFQKKKLFLKPNPDNPEEKIFFSIKDYKILQNLDITNFSNQLQLVSILKKYDMTVREFFIVCVFLLFEEEENFIHFIFNKKEELMLGDKEKALSSDIKRKLNIILEKIKEKREIFWKFCYNYK